MLQVLHDCVCVLYLYVCYTCVLWSSVSGQCLASCMITECRCPSTAPPGDLLVSDTPQMILITFTGAVDGEFLKKHSKIFPINPPKERRNPNRCPMVSTVFVREKRTDFCAVNRLWAFGHEIALNGQALRDEGYWTTGSVETFANEFVKTRNNLMDKANVPEDEIYGVRSPVYKGNENYYTVVDELGMEYDSTLTLASQSNAESSVPPTFPFTMNHQIDGTYENINCLSQLCPAESYPYLWQVPVFLLQNGSDVCKDLVLCRNITETSGNSVFLMLLNNFNAHYKDNRVPFVVNLDILRLKQDKQETLIQGLNLFLDYVSDLDDAWVVSMHQAVSWMRTPRSVSEADSLAAWGCQTHLMDACQVEGMSDDELTSGEDDKPDGTDEEKHRNTIKGLFPNGEVLVIWQTVVLVVLFFIVYQYDKKTNNHK